MGHVTLGVRPPEACLGEARIPRIPWTGKVVLTSTGLTFGEARCDCAKDSGRELDNVNRPDLMARGLTALEKQRG